MKCLPHAKIPLAVGMVLHDCHAEGEFRCSSVSGSC